MISSKSCGAGEIRRIEGLAGLLDDRFRVPGTRLRFGLDGLIGLIPGVGDVVTAAMALYLLVRARKAGASRSVLLRMVGNIGLDLAVGAIPVVGDLFDFGFKANRRNVRLLKEHLERPTGA